VGIRILLIEDDELIGSSLERGLREEGYSVERAVDGKAGWEFLRRGGWELVILDWWLPTEDGLVLLRKFRELERQTPVLFLTARDGVNERVRGLDAGADDYLCKPFVFDELLARVRALLRRAEDRPGAVLERAGVSIDLATQRVQRGAATLDLTAKEYSLLVYFVRHYGQVVSRTRIYEQVWDDRYDGLSNTIEVHVSELRRKLENHGDRLIHTLRGRGYVFGPQPGDAL